MLYESCQAVIKLSNAYFLIISEGKYKKIYIYGEWLKILTPTKCFKRLPIALAQVKAGNTSENLN